MARHLAPFWCRQTIAESVRRRSWGGVLPLGRLASTSGSNSAHCAFVSIAPPLSRGAKRPQPHPVQARTGLSLEGWVCVFYRGGGREKKKRLGGYSGELRS